MTNGQIKGKNRTDLTRRLITSVAVLSLLIPFVVFGSMPKANFGYDIFFTTMLTALSAYAVFEITNALVPVKNRQNDF